MELTADISIERHTPIAGIPHKKDGMTEWEVRINGRVWSGACKKRSSAVAHVAYLIEHEIEKAGR